MNFQDLKNRLLQNPEVKQEYDRLSPYYEIQQELIEARLAAKLTQKELSQKLNIKQSVVSNFERKELDYRVSTLIKYAEACGKKLKIEFVDQ